MITLGKTARELRVSQGVTQRRAAELLEVSVVHLCNIENGKSAPSPALLDRYRELWGVDLYVLAWCLNGDIEKLPPTVRKHATELGLAWKRQLDRISKKKEPKLGC